MPEQLQMRVDQYAPIPFTLFGCDYEIVHDASRSRLKPKWYVVRLSDFYTTDRYYTWPDGAFSAVFWGRCKWSA